MFSNIYNFLGKKVVQIFVFSTVLGVLWFFAETSFILIVQALFYNLGLVTDKNVYFKDYLPTSVEGVALSLFLFTCLRSLLSGLKNYYGGMSVQAFLHHQKEVLLTNLSNDNNLKMSSHEMITLLNQNVSQAANVVRLIATCFTAATSSILLFGFGLTIAPTELLIGFGILIIFVLPFKFVNREVELISSSISRNSKNINRYVNLSLKNYYILRIYQYLKREINKGIKILDHQYSLMRRYYILTSLKSTIPLLVGGAVISVLLYIIVLYREMDNLKLLAFFYVFIRLSQSLSESMLLGSGIRMHYCFAKELYDVYIGYKNRADMKEDSYPVIDVVQNRKFNESISEKGVNLLISDLVFQYDGSKNIFQQFSLDVKAGETLVIKGPSGVGKSTLLSLILGIQQPKSGSIKINNYNLSEIRNSFINLIGYVGPDSHIIPGTIRENLSYCCDELNEIEDHQLLEVMKIAQIDELVNSLPEKLDTNLSENTELSTGQKQRLAIARALLRKPRLLIFDEATSNLDKDTEREVIESILSKINNLTTIVITHRDSFDKYASKVLTLT